MDRLIVICEGGVHTVEYLHKNGVFPHSLVIDPNKFQEMSPYLNKEDDILLIVKGLTDFSMATIYSLLKKFDMYKDKYKRVTILSNIPLGAVNYDYYLYSGDLFYGTVKKIINKKEYDLDSNGNVVELKQKNTLFKKKSIEITKKINPISFQFKKYNNRKIKLMIYGKVHEETIRKPTFEYENEVKAIDLFK